MAEPAFWLLERGIGEDRALLIDNGAAVVARIEPHDILRIGAVADARVVKQFGTVQQGATRRRGIVRLHGGQSALLDALPAGVGEGAIVRVIIARAGLAEKDGEHQRAKLPHARIAPADATPGPGDDLSDQIGLTDYPVRLVSSHGADLLSQHGYYDILEAARSRVCRFTGGSLTIGLTAGMTVIDVDGDGTADALALAAASQAARWIGLLGLSGSVGIDFPTLPEKARRQALADAFDAAMRTPCERTGVNGFGFMQVVIRRVRPSLPEYFAADPIGAAARDLLRRAERLPPSGALHLTAHPDVAACLESRRDWLGELERRSGRVAIITPDPHIAIEHGDAAARME